MMVDDNGVWCRQDWQGSHKAAEKVGRYASEVKRLNGLVRIVTEIHSHFPQGVKIYEIQNEHELLEAKK